MQNGQWVRKIVHDLIQNDGIKLLFGFVIQGIGHDKAGRGVSLRASMLYCERGDVDPDVPLIAVPT